MPNRILREGVLTSEPVNSLSWPAEVFYRRLMSVVDDFGRYYAKPELIRAACYPLQLDKVGNQDVAKWLGETQKAGLVMVYTVEGKAYLEILNFKQSVRAKHGSKYPACTADATHVLSGCDADAPVDVDVDVCVDAPRKRGSPKRPMPNGFSITERVKAWASREGYTNLDQHFAAFVSKARAKGYTYADWDEGLMGAMREDWAKIGKGSREQVI